MTGNRLVQVVQEKGIITATLEKGEGGQGGGKDGVSADGKTIVVFSDDLDRALASFVIADLCILDQELQLVEVIAKGNTVYTK